MNDHIKGTYTSLIFGTLLCVILVILMGQVHGEITVDQAGEGDYTTIQQAIDNATDGETIRISPGVYKENIVVNRSMSLIGNGEDPGSVTIDGNGTNSTILVVADDVTMKGLRVIGGGAEEQDARIRIEGANITIIDSIVSGNGYHGIVGTMCRDLVISGTNCSDQFQIGIVLQDVIGLVLDGNRVVGNRVWGIYIDTGTEVICMNNIMVGNILRGGSFHGIEDSVFRNNTCSGSYDGLAFLEGSNSNLITRNNCSGNNHTGITLMESCNSNIITENTCDLNGIYAGIYLSNDCSNNTIDNNTCTRNGYCGIYIYKDCTDNTITNNTLTRSSYAVWLSENCVGNKIHWNQFEGNNNGVITDTSSPVNAENNFWGHNTGPRNAERNPDGIGSAASDEVDFDPWLTRSEDPPEAFIETIFPNPCEQGATIRLTGSGEDNGAIVRYVWTASLDGELYDGPLPTFEFSEFSLGDQTITLVVEDDIGLLSDPVTSMLNVYEGTGANERPTVTISSPVDQQVVEGRVTFRGTASDPNGMETITKVELKVVLPVWSSAEYDETTGEWTANWNSRQWEDGSYTVEVRAFDGTRYSETVTLTIVVENGDDDDNEVCGLALLIIALAFALFFLLGFKGGYFTKMMHLIRGRGA